jgi:hypothetical protein
MNSDDFVIWLKGFFAAANPYNVTPEQFNIIKEQLEKVVSNDISKLLKDPNTFTTRPFNPSPSMPWQSPTTVPYPWINPLNPYLIYCGGATSVNTTMPSGSAVTYSSDGAVKPEQATININKTILTD